MVHKGDRHRRDDCTNQTCTVAERRASLTVSFEQGSYTVSEGNSVTIKVKLSADPERMVAIPTTKSDQGGATPSDYSGA